MKKNDIIFAIIAGLSVAWITIDFFGKYALPFFFILPLLSLIGLWIVDLIGKKTLSVKQVGRFFLVGSFADVVDIKVFQLLFIIAPFSLFFKAVSFLTATFIKYWINKYWAFEKRGLVGAEKEMAKFFMVAIVGLLLNVVSFYFLGRIKVGISAHLWTELSIILAAIVTGLWNFCGYKFLVFKK